MMGCKVVPVTPFVQNCTIFWCRESRSAVVIDPGGDVDRILSEIKLESLQVERILLTHGHIDHSGGAPKLAQALNVEIWGPQQEDKFWLDALEEQSYRFGTERVLSFEPDHWLTHGDSIGFGSLTLEVLHTPGHTPGHVVFFERQARIAQVGDVLFAGSIGRSDFPRSDGGLLLRSIREVLLPLGDDVAFIPGHGPMSTFGEERKNNPFVKQS